MTSCQRGDTYAGTVSQGELDLSLSARLFKVGNQIIFAKYIGTEFKIDDEENWILSEKDILGVVRTTSRCGVTRQLK